MSAHRRSRRHVTRCDPIGHLQPADVYLVIGSAGINRLTLVDVAGEQLVAADLSLPIATALDLVPELGQSCGQLGPVHRHRVLLRAISSRGRSGRTVLSAAAVIWREATAGERRSPMSPVRPFLFPSGYRVNAGDTALLDDPPGPVAVTVAMYVPGASLCTVWLISTLHSPFVTDGLRRSTVATGVAVSWFAPDL
jgi:hypothetical protein